MKVIMHEKGFLLIGKGGDILQKLREQSRHFTTVSEWTAKSMEKQKL